MEEKELIQRCIELDEQAWNIFLERYADCIYGTIVNVLKKHSLLTQELAEDIFADIIQKLLSDSCRALRRFRWNSRFTTWLISITRNRTYDYIRKIARRSEMSIDEPIEGDEDQFMRQIADDLDLEEEANARITVQELIDMLPEKDKLVLKLYYLEGMKEEEIGQLLNLSADAVSSRKARALQKLRKVVRKN